MSEQRMITQQQRNNKRQRASPHQAAFLRRAFLENQRPDQVTREMIGSQIDMTQRSVQIWFQNKRAKLKNAEKHTRPGSVPTFTSACGKRTFRVQVDVAALGGSLSPAPSCVKESLQLTCTSLTIGNWSRFRSLTTAQPNLWVYVSRETSMLTYAVSHNDQLFSIRIPFQAIKSVYVSPFHEQGQMCIQVDPCSITFHVQGFDGTWLPCTDISSGQCEQADSHFITGPLKDLYTDADTIRSCIPSNSGVLTPESPLFDDAPLEDYICEARPYACLSADSSVTDFSNFDILEGESPVLSQSVSLGLTDLCPDVYQNSTPAYWQSSEVLPHSYPVPAPQMMDMVPLSLPDNFGSLDYSKGDSPEQYEKALAGLDWNLQPQYVD